MERKITNAVYALYGGALATLFGAVANYLQFQQLHGGMELEHNLGLSPAWVLSFATFPILIVGATYFIAQNLKAKKKWSWIMALSLLTINFSEVAILFSIYGVIQLCDREVREYFLKQMDISLD
jgi:hypothetical protein